MIVIDPLLLNWIKISVPVSFSRPVQLTNGDPRPTLDTSLQTHHGHKEPTTLQEPFPSQLPSAVGLPCSPPCKLRCPCPQTRAGWWPSSDPENKSHVWELCPGAEKALARTAVTI